MVNSFKFLKYKLNKDVLYVILNNPKKHNALNPKLIGELEQIFYLARVNQKIKAICIKANGKNFCSGADLNWMSSASHMSERENYLDMLRLVRMYRAILSFKGPVVAQVQGHAIGGGVGIACACDFVICEKNTIFTMPEVKLGLIPGVITPIVSRKIGKKAFSFFAKSALPISAKTSLKLKLASMVVSKENLNKSTNKLLSDIISKSYSDFVKSKKIQNQKKPIPLLILKMWAKASAQKRKSKKFQNLKYSGGNRFGAFVTKREV